MTAEELLKLCHAYLRGAEINDPSGCKQINKDELARLINQYLNDIHPNTTEPQGQAHHQDQRHPSSPTDQAPV